ncbi:MAG: methyltransferase type 11 [Candidatus Moranbacteria bacterium CG10_big_fil_rev_8_21_14_0_10_35_21]|nr:MAG: methyltransferase type 11 [Candidatus Moranbacteria bacterium CG10_big_fil_rev_8_21_14_0_10_35_21]PJA88491.1 MAG: methyltransferase type 11 [Candidatus Moranbacteria bacterium CG_4_9_14_3_um_filter_36_9]
MKKLNLGCGNVLMEGYINLDNNPNTKPDIIHNLNNYPYPFSDSEFDEIYLDHTIEHLEDSIRLMQELYRIGKNDCTIIIKCPHFSCNWFHPGHKTAISSKFFTFFDNKNIENYGKTDFKVLVRKLYWIRNGYLTNRSVAIKITDKIINFIANVHIGFAERVWCYWVGGFEEIYFKAKVIK